MARTISLGGGGLPSAAVGILLAALLAQSIDAARGQQTRNKGGQAVAIRDYRSPHFLVHSDIEADEAKELLGKLETMLGLISAYWGRPMSGVLECYVAKDLDKWPPALLARLDPRGLAKIQEGAGICLSRTLEWENKFVAKAVVYAVADHDTVQHESVHGYCSQTFGRCGPDWYAEGMAELGNYWKKGEKGVKVPAPVLRHLRSSEPLSVAEIISMRSMNTTWQNYAWCWSLCHVLENNPNYSATFRRLGLALLLDKPGSFETAFGPAAQQLQFEHSQFIAHLEPGLRADLIAWNWDRKFTPLTTSPRPAACYVLAGRGWQPSGLTVSAGVEYEYTATGSWKLDKESDSVDADGGSEGAGRLVGVLMKDYQLGEEFPLGKEGSFQREEEGDLYLRCAGPWTSLEDNTGRMRVRIKVKGARAR